MFFENTLSIYTLFSNFRFNTQHSMLFGTLDVQITAVNSPKIKKMHAFKLLYGNEAWILDGRKKVEICF